MFGFEITDAIRDMTLESFSFDDLASMDLDMIVSELTGAPLPNDRDKIWVTYADVEKYVIDKVNEKHDAAPH
jgi:hypothetical protein